MKVIYTVFYTTKSKGKICDPPEPDYNEQDDYGWKTENINSLFSQVEEINLNYGQDGWNCFGGEIK